MECLGLDLLPFDLNTQKIGHHHIPEEKNKEHLLYGMDSFSGSQGAEAV